MRTETVYTYYIGLALKSMSVLFWISAHFGNNAFNLCLSGKQNHSVVSMTSLVWHRSWGSVSQTGQTPTREAFLSAARQLPPHWACVCVKGKRVDFWENKAHNKGTSTQSTPCLSPSILHGNVKRIFFENQTVTNSKCEQASKKQISLPLHTNETIVYVLQSLFSL